MVVLVNFWEILMKIKLFFLLFLASCTRYSEILIDKENIPITDSNKIIFIKLFKVENTYRKPRIAIYEKGKLELTSKYLWNSSIRNIFSEHLAYQAAKRGIWLSCCGGIGQSVDVIVDKIFYDKTRKLAIINALLRFNKKVYSLIVEEQVDHPRGFSRAFEELSRRTVEIIVNQLQCNKTTD